MKHHAMIAALLLVSACADEQADVSLENNVPPFGVQIARPEGTVPQAPDSLYNVYFPLALEAISNKNLSWKEADRIVRSALQGYGRGPLAYELEQAAGSFMINDRLLKVEAGEERNEALAFYTTLLLRNHHGDPRTMASALSALGGTWPDARLRAAAADAQAAAEAFADQLGGCGTAEQCAALPEDRRRADAGARAMGDRYAEGNAALEALF